MEEIKEQYNPFDKMTFTYDKCFLCGALLTDQNRSDEHIYPKWLQKMFNLWDKKLVLLNGTDISYKDLKIPCCKSCNGQMSMMFENPIKSAVSAGFDNFHNLDKNLIFLWLNKMSYGMLFKELSLDVSRSEPEKGKIYSPEFLKEHQMQYMFLQTILTNATYAGKPYSMLVFKIDPCEIENYWAHDNPFKKTFFIRMNDIGIIAHLMDNGYNEEFFLEFPEMKELTDRTLHPLQFVEICARFLYKCSLFYRNPSYIMMMDEEQKPNMVLSQGMAGYGYNDWSQEDYAKILAYFWEPFGISYENIYKGGDKVLSLLHHEDGSFNDLISTFKEIK